MKQKHFRAVVVVAATCFSLSVLACAQGREMTLAPRTMARVGSIDERYQSYNIEMVEVTGGRFWKPYASKTAVVTPKDAAANQPAGMDASLYEYRPPIDLTNARLRKLAAALAPAYVRVSGTWANSTYFQTSESAKIDAAPEGFKGVLTRAQWKGVVDFAASANADLVTSFAMSAGTRGSGGIWEPAQAEALLMYTKSVGGKIAAAEFMNEPTFAEMGGAPKGYDAAAFGRDMLAFQSFAKRAAPEMLLLGPGGVGEGSSLVPASMKLLATADLFKATGPVFDAVSYHSYGGVSSRCGRAGMPSSTSAEAALSEEWLGRGEGIEAYYSQLRDHFEPGKPLWNTETAQTACGGDRWASTFLDTFRYLNQLGVLAKKGVQVHMHNTLAASDYGLLDEKTYLPRPNYWAALLWRKMMGTTVLETGKSTVPSLHLFAHCLRQHPGGVAVLAINLDQQAPAMMTLPSPAEEYTLTAKELLATQVQLNGAELALNPDDSLPEIKAELVKTGKVALPAASITFLAFPGANNASCR